MVVAGAAVSVKPAVDVSGSMSWAQAWEPEVKGSEPAEVSQPLHQQWLSLRENRTAGLETIRREPQSLPHLKQT